MSGKAYRGIRHPSGKCVVAVWQDGASLGQLKPRRDLRDHSPDGFNWSYGGSGPSQLALAICCDALGDDARALRIYQAFKFAAIATIDGDTFELGEVEALALIERLEHSGARGAQ